MKIVEIIWSNTCLFSLGFGQFLSPGYCIGLDVWVFYWVLPSFPFIDLLALKLECLLHRVVEHRKSKLLVFNLRPWDLCKNPLDPSEVILSVYQGSGSEHSSTRNSYLKDSLLGLTLHFSQEEVGFGIWHHSWQVTKVVHSAFFCELCKSNRSMLLNKSELYFSLLLSRSESAEKYVVSIKLFFHLWEALNQIVLQDDIKLWLEMFLIPFRQRPSSNDSDFRNSWIIFCISENLSASRTRSSDNCNLDLLHWWRRFNH